MQIDSHTAAEARAIDWLIAQRDPEFADWDGFTDWLAADPGHAAIFDALASLDADLAALAPTPIIAANDGAVRPSRRAWFGGAIAAALVGVVGLSVLGTGDAVTRIETAAGEQRTVTLADGSTVAINGASVVVLDAERPRFVRLERGEAMFEIVHRADRPFVVEAGGARIVDLGTAFNIVRRTGSTSVAVSEGAVVFNPARGQLRLVAGQAIEAKDGASGSPVIRDIDIANVGAWRTGLLVYAGTPLTLVAEDLQRTAGIAVTVAPDAAQIPFRGALILSEDRSRTVADLAALSGTRARRSGNGWVLAR